MSQKKLSPAPEELLDETSEVSDEHSGFYWFFKHMSDSVKGFSSRHKFIFAVIAVLTLVSLFMLRVNIHPLAIVMRKYFGAALIGLPILIGMWLLVRKRSWKAQMAIWVMYLLIAGTTIFCGKEVHNYLAFYFRYNSLPIVELKELPLTDHERIQPLNSVYSLANEIMIDSESPTPPNFVRIGDDYRWTMAIEPAYIISRIMGDVRELFNIPGTSPSPNFSKENRVKVVFQVGENLVFSRKTRTAVIKRFGPWRFFNYEPADVTYITNDEGKWVQVVSLIRWKGIIFPRPEFGGVQVIEQGNSFMTIPELVLTGAGKWIKPDQISQHKYLVGQNILSYTVSRYIANSFRFQNGFLSPLPGYHKGDTRIPDLPEDVNKQPFSAYFQFEEGKNEKNMLYHYFALEPFDPDKQGLNTSMFIPADGSESVYIHKHYEQTGSLTGVSAITAKIKDSKKNYDWDDHFPVEHRPYIKKLGGKKRFFWLTTIVTRKEEGTSRFIAGKAPELVITDASYNAPVWVNPLKPESWQDQLVSELSESWKDE